MLERPAETAALIMASAKNWARARREGGREGRKEGTILVSKEEEEVEVESPQRIAEEEEGEEGLEGEERDKIAILR
jgi:hypothetical protein